MGGRCVWSSPSGYIGRKPIYMVYLGVGIVLYIILATLGSTATWIFVLTAAVIISFYGGGLSPGPAPPPGPLPPPPVGAPPRRRPTPRWARGGVGPPLRHLLPD